MADEPERELSLSSTARLVRMDRHTLAKLCDQGLVRCRIVQGLVRRRVWIPISEIERLNAEFLP